MTQFPLAWKGVFSLLTRKVNITSSLELTWQQIPLVHTYMSPWTFTRLSHRPYPVTAAKHRVLFSQRGMAATWNVTCHLRSRARPMGKRGQTHLVGIGSDRGKMGTNIAQKSKQIVPKKSFCLKSCAREGVDKDERDSGKTDSKAKRS